MGTDLLQYILHHGISRYKSASLRLDGPQSSVCLRPLLKYRTGPSRVPINRRSRVRTNGLLDDRHKIICGAIVIRMLRCSTAHTSAVIDGRLRRHGTFFLVLGTDN